MKRPWDLYLLKEPDNGPRNNAFTIINGDKCDHCDTVTMDVTSKICSAATIVREYIEKRKEWISTSSNRFPSQVIMNASQDPTYPLFPVFAFLGFVLCCIPLSWHIQAWNSGTCAFMIWTAVACLTEFVNCIVWTGNINNPAPVWCDICEFSSPVIWLRLTRRLQLRKLSWVSVLVYQRLRCVLVDASTTLLHVIRLPLRAKM